MCAVIVYTADFCTGLKSGEGDGLDKILGQCVEHSEFLPWGSYLQGARVGKRGAQCRCLGLRLASVSLSLSVCV